MAKSSFSQQLEVCSSQHPTLDGPTALSCCLPHLLPAFIPNCAPPLSLLRSQKQVEISWILQDCTLFSQTFTKNTLSVPAEACPLSVQSRKTAQRLSGAPNMITVTITSSTYACRFQYLHKQKGEIIKNYSRFYQRLLLW